MIAIRDKDTVYFANSVPYHNTYPSLRVDATTEETMHLWHLNDGLGTIVMLAVRSDRITDVLRYSDMFDSCEMTLESLRALGTRVRELYEESNCYENDGDVGVTIYIARGDLGFRVYSSGSVIAVEEFASSGCFDNLLRVGYELTRDIEDIHKRIAAIYHIVATESHSCAFPVAVINTRDDTYTLLTGEE